MAPVKRTFEQADQGWTNEQALASELGHALGDEQFPSGASHSSSQQNSTDVAEGPAVQQAVQSAPPAKRPRKARRKRSDPPPDYSAAVQRNMSGLSRAAQACDRCKYRKVPCDHGYPACENCRKENLPCVTTDRVTGRPIARGYLERVESYAFDNYQRSRHLQVLFMNTWNYAYALEAHVQQLSHIVTQSGLPHPSPQIPENLWRAFHETNPGAAFAQLDRPPTPPPFPSQETIDLTGDEGDYHPQGLGEVYPAPPSRYIATDILQGPNGQPSFAPPPQYPNDTIDPSVLMPAWSPYRFDGFDTGVQAGTESTAPFLDSEQHHVPENSDTCAQGSADQPAPAAEAATVDNSEHPGDSQPLSKVPSSPPLNFSVLDDKNFDDFHIPHEPLDLEPGADLGAFLAHLQGADANPVQSPQPYTSVPASVPADVDASVHVVVPAAVDPYVPASVFPSSEPDSIDRELAEFLAEEPSVAEPQALFDLPSGSPKPGSAHADDADSLFEGSLGISSSSAGGETAPTNEAPAGSGKTYNLGDFRFSS
ncbi:hypothetical protein ATERTT37_000567 [Aspergillus terreus]